MNAKLYVLIAIFGVVQGAYLVDDAYGRFDDYGEEEFGDDSAEWMVGWPQGPIKPPSPRLKTCQPGFCCPVDLQCRSLFCVDPVHGNKIHPVLVC